MTRAKFRLELTTDLMWEPSLLAMTVYQSAEC